MELPELRNFQVACDKRGVVTAALDLPGRTYNLFTEQVLAELQTLVAYLERDPAARLVIFRSAKQSGFLAGGDLRSVSALQDCQSADKIVIFGQKLFDRLEGLPMPTVAAIHGPCLGGGLEFALACRYRVARDDDSTRLALPEITLGLLPAWGGTQRLPELVGLAAALPMLLAGRKLSVRNALAIGLLDAAWPADRWNEGLEQFVVARLDEKPLRRQRPNLLTRRGAGTEPGPRRSCGRRAGGWRSAAGMARRCRQFCRPSRKGSVSGATRDWHGNAKYFPICSSATFAVVG